MERFRFFMERFSIRHGADVRSAASIRNPTAETSPFPVTPKDGDQILVPTGDGLPVNYTYDAAQSQWYRYETVPVIRNNVQIGVRRQRVYVDSAAISAGTGFWYLNTDGAKNVEW